MGIVVLLVVIAAATPWMLRNSGSLMTKCQNATQSMGVGVGLCSGFSEALATVNQLAGRAGGIGDAAQADITGSWNGQMDAWRQQLAGLQQRWDAITYRLDAGQAWSGGNPLSKYVDMDQVGDILKHGGGGSFGGGQQGQLTGAMSYFTAGQRQMAVDPKDAMKLYKQGAGMGEFGIMSQLKLGSLYMGQGGMENADLAQASHYNSQALSSLQSLEMNSSPEAQNMLSGLPLEPTQLRIQLQDLQRRLQQVQ